jgi:hypothetical protein
MRASAAPSLALAIALPLLGCHRTSHSGAPGDALTQARARAVDYLTSIYSPEHLFDDPYLTCKDQSDVCDPAFRELDHAVLVEFWLPDALRADPRLAKIDQRSRRVLDGWLERWRDRPLDLTAVDLYALFPYYYPGESTHHMLDEVARGMSDEGDWEPYTAHALPYRKVTDELWTVLALVRNHVADKTQIALDRKREEAQRILHGSFAAWRPTAKFYALSHIALLFLLTSQAGYDVAPFRPLLDEVEAWLAAATENPALARSTAILAEDLEILSLAGHPDRARLARVAQILLERQEPNGRWRADLSESSGDRARSPDFAAAHTTLIALAATEAWAHHDAYAAARLQRRWLMLSGPAPSPPPDTELRPPIEYAMVGGRRVAVGFPVAEPRQIEFINEARTNWENSVLFFPPQQVRAELDRLAGERSPRADADRERTRALLEIVERAAAFRPSPQGIRAERDGGLVTLHVALQLHGPGAGDAFAARAASAIEGRWCGAASGARVVTRVDARVRPESAPPSADALSVFVPRGAGSPYTRRVGDLGNIPTTWPEHLHDPQIAHEMGHFFGFADEYHVESRDGFYYVVHDQPERIMSHPEGHVSADDLDVLVRAYLHDSPKQ